MNSKRIEIERRWIPKGTGTYLREEASVTLANLPPTKIIFLTGEPGSGKSDTIETYVRNSAGKAIYKLFSEINSTQIVKEWLEEAYAKQAELYIDAYDEKSPTFRKQYLIFSLNDAVSEGRMPLLRISSRGTHLPEYFAEEVNATNNIPLTPTNNFEIKELTKKEMEWWIHQKLVNRSSHFIDQIEKNLLWHHITKPCDLQSFIDVFDDTGKIGETVTDAWEKAIYIALREPNSDRQDSGLNISAKFDSYERYKAAQILAVAQYVCEPKPILIHHLHKSNSNGFETEDLWNASKEYFKDYDKQRFEALITETAQSQLFEQGKDGIYFQSAAKAQFLAASLLKNAEPNQITNMFKDRAEGRRIHERALPVIAELSKYLPEVFNWMCEHQPDGLLSGIVVEFNDNQKEKLIDSIMRQSVKTETWFPNLSRLNHPNIVSQLEPYLSVNDKYEETLTLAIELCECCRCESLSDNLLKIAMSDHLTIHTRKNAAHALGKFGIPLALNLKALMDLELEQDPERQLLNIALTYLWPSTFPPKNAFELLCNSDAVATVSAIGKEHLMESLTLEYVKEGLEWLCNNFQDDLRFDESLLNLLVLKAWQYIEHINVVEKLAQFINLCMKKHRMYLLSFGSGNQKSDGYCLSKIEFCQNEDKRWSLFRIWLSMQTDLNSNLDALTFVQSSEMHLLLQELNRSSGITAELLRSVAQHVIIEHIRLGQSENMQQFESELQQHGLSINDLNRDYHLEIERQEARNKPLMNGHDDKIHCQEFQNKLNDLCSTSLFDVYNFLSISEDVYELSINNCFTRMPRWYSLSENNKWKVVGIAKQFLNSNAANPLSTYTNMSWHVLMTFYAVNLIESTDCEWLGNWDHREEWLPHLILRHSYLTFRLCESKELCGTVENRLIIDAIIDSIKCRLKVFPNPFDVDRFDGIIDSQIGAGLLSRFWDLDTLQQKAILVTLLLNKQVDLKDHLSSLISSGERHIREFSVRLVVRFEISELYPLVSQIALANTSVCNCIWKELWHTNHIKLGRNFNGYDICILIWLFERAVRRAPISKDKPHRSGAPEKRVSRQSLRGQLASAITASNTVKGWEYALKWSEEPGWEWLRRSVVRNRNQWLESSWEPPTLSSVIEICSDRSKRHIATQSDLHDVVLAALDAESTRFVTLGFVGKVTKSGKPAADETDLTEILCSFLSYRLPNVVVNMEVKLRNGRTDIQIEAIGKNPLGDPARLKCVIEAKKCTYAGFDKSLRTQLYDIYLKDGSGATGIFLVFWFCDAKVCSHEDRVLIEKALEVQALDLLPTRVSVRSYGIPGKPFKGKNEKPEMETGRIEAHDGNRTQLPLYEP